MEKGSSSSDCTYCTVSHTTDAMICLFAPHNQMDISNVKKKTYLKELNNLTVAELHPLCSIFRGENAR